MVEVELSVQWKATTNYTAMEDAAHEGRSHTCWAARLLPILEVL